jgi:hypothetical protein
LAVKRELWFCDRALHPLISKSFWSIKATIFDARFFLELFTNPVPVVSVAETGATSTVEHVLHLALDVTPIAISNIAIVAVFA